MCGYLFGETLWELGWGFEHTMGKFTRRSVLQYGVGLTALSELSSRLTIVSQASADTEDVRLFGADRQNTGVYEASPLQEAPGIEWEYEASASVNSIPAIVDGRVFVCTDAKRLHVIDTETGEGQVVYDPDFPEEESHISANPAVVDDTVYVGFRSSDSGYFVAIDTESFNVNWRFQTDSGVSSSAVPAGSTVYIGGYNEGLYALDSDTGEVQWENEDDSYGAITPAITENALLAPALSGIGSLSRVERETGEIVWNFDQAEGDIMRSPAVSGGTAYVGSSDEFLYAVDFETGEQQWKFETGDWVSSSPSVADGMVYVGTRGNNVFAIDAATGEQQWVHNFDFWVTGKPAIVDGVVYVASWDNTVIALTAEDGNKLWSVQPGGDLRAGVVPVGNRIYAPSHDGSLYALSAAVENTQQSSQQASQSTESSTNKDTSTNETSIVPFVDGSTGLATPLLGGTAILTSTIAGIGLWRWQSSGDGGNDPVAQSVESKSGPSDTDPAGIESPTLSGPSVDADQIFPVDSPETIPAPSKLSISYDDLSKNDKIGVGGNADIYKATVSSGSSTVEVAIKEPRIDGTAHADEIERLLDEAVTWAALDEHDHIVGLVDYGSSPLPWIAMEYMDGGHLGERIGDFSVSQAMWTAHAITRGVRHAHRQGVAHLDLKPENILFRSVEGAWDIPKVGDWGFSKQLLDHSQTLEGLSPHYAAPEQFDDERGPTDERTDIYQLGAVFYTLFTGRPPFEGKNTNVMRKTLTEQPVPPSQVNSALPSALDEVLLTALAKERANRYESVLYLRDHISQLLEIDGEDTYTFATQNQSTDEWESNQAIDTDSAPIESQPHVSTRTYRSDSMAAQQEQSIRSDTNFSYDDITVGDPISRTDVSTVYRAQLYSDTGSRPIALKEPHLDETIQNDVVKQFASEAATWQKLATDDRIVDVIGWGVEPAPWIALEYMDKGDLRSIIDQISPGQTTVVGSQLTEAVHHAHTRGIAHLDLKPENVLLTTNAEGTKLKISDWGIGRLSLQHSRSADGLELTYTAPEQLNEDLGKPGPPTDVYALGAICYELFTGTKPYGGSPADIMRSTLAGEFVPPTDIDPTLPNAVDEILRTALATDPTARYESVLYFRDDLQKLA